MRLAVLVKMIPDLAQARISKSQGQLITAAPPILNPVDVEALECALRMRDRAGAGEVMTMTLGDPAIEGSLKKLATLGADQLVLVDHAGVAMDDPLSRASVLAAALQRLGPCDHVMAGAGSITGGGGVTAYAVAEALGCAARPGVMTLEEIPPAPSLITVAPGAFLPRPTSITSIGRAAKVPLTRWPAQGTSEPPRLIISREFVPDPETSPSRLAPSRGDGALPPADWRGLLVIGDGPGSTVTPPTRAVLALAAEIAQLLGARVTAVIVGTDAAGRAAIRHGADVVKLCASADSLLDRLATLITTEHPEAVLWDDQPATRLAAGRLAQRLGTGCVVGATYLAVDAESRQLIMTQSLYDGRLAREVVIPTRPQLVTVAAAAHGVPLPDATRTGEVTPL